MSARPTSITAYLSDWLRGGYAWGPRLFSSLTGNHTAPPVPGPLRAARFLSFGRPSFFELRNNPLRYISDVFKFGGSAPVGRRIAGRAYRPSDARPVAFTKILVGPDFTAFNCSVLQIDELADWLARQEKEEEEIAG